MKKEIFRYVKLMVGIALAALGVVTVISSNFGLSPWDVLNQGLNKVLGITHGQANILVGSFALLISLYYKQPLGMGTVLNYIFIGVFIDLYMYLDFIPKGDLLLSKIFIHFSGMLIFSLGIVLYISSGLGCGPRDGLMVVFTKRTRFSVGTIKTFTEIAALSMGWVLGGFVGIGTMISTLSIGYIIQFFFKVAKVDVKQVYHRSLSEELSLFKNLLFQKNN